MSTSVTADIWRMKYDKIIRWRKYYADCYEIETVQSVLQEKRKNERSTCVQIILYLIKLFFSLSQILCKY